MGQYEKLLEKLKNSPQNLTVAQLQKILLKSGYKKRNGSKHIIFRKGSKMLTLSVHDNECKECYKEDIRDAIFSEIENEQGEE